MRAAAPTTAGPAPGARRRRRRPRPPLVAVLVALLLVAACSDDEAPAAQPAPDVARFAEGEFDALPVPPRADATGERTEDGDVVARSFTVRGSSPEDVVEFYVTALDGWVHEGTTDVGTALRSEFTRDGRALRVTAQPAPAVESGTVDGDEVVTQLSLQLGPPDLLDG